MTQAMPTAVILAAGESSRFWPLSTHGHKSLHRLCGCPIIEHTVRSLVSAGITDIVIVQSTGRPDSQFPYRSVEHHLADGVGLGARISYVSQPEPRGQRDAILRAATDISGDFIIINPENLNAGEIARELLASRGDAAAVIAAQEREDTWQFGVFEESDGQLSGFVEKPARGSEPSQLCNMSVQLVTPRYVELLNAESDQDPAANLTALVKLAHESPVRICVTTAQFFPLKYPWDLFQMAQYLKPAGKPYLGENVRINPTASVDPGSVIEQDTVIGSGVTVTGSLVGAGSHIKSSVSNSVFGADVQVEEGVTIKAVDAQPTVSATVKGASVDSGLSSLGALVGQGSTLKAGVTVGAGAMIGAQAEVTTDVAAAGSVPDQTA